MLRFIHVAVLLTAIAAHAEPARTPMKDFIGLNGHFQFKPELYKQVCRQVRNYHNMNWDVKKPGDPPTFPVCVNKVNWKEHAYGKWKAAGFEIDICAQFGSFGRGNERYRQLWTDQESWAHTYGYEMARYFGPSGKEKLCTAIEIGNEPGNEFDDPLYRRIFTNMARGIRKADPRIKIVTCTAQARAADKYSKSLQDTFGSEEMKALYDVINLHVYALKPKKKGRSPWARSYPEDPGIAYLKIVDEAITWRNQNAPGKEIWITEFGWDACTDGVMAKRTGWFLKLDWDDVSDLQQAQYLVRSLFCFSAREIDRAYIYFFNDSDQPSVHAASGLTRNFKPKPSFWAVKHLYETLGDFRFDRVVKKTAELYLFEYRHAKDRRSLAWVAWSPTAEGKAKRVILPTLPGNPVKIETMATENSGPGTIKPSVSPRRRMELPVSGSPIYIFMRPW